ncbi:MAG: glycosyltransferase family 2 protein [Bacilli bacterium]|nr:glycosyltransferase family 2 protein [Bacilli bacterium]
MKKISMIVPCYNEEGNVKLFFEDAIKTYKNNKKYEIELIFIDDGSYDNTLNELREIAKTKECKVKVLSFSRNFGKESVIYAGLKSATGDYTVLIDADMQQPPHLTLKMAEILDAKKEVDCVCYYQAKRIESKLMSKIKGSFYKTMNKLSDVELKQGASDFRMFRINVKEALLSLEERCRFTKGIFSWVGFNTTYLPYTPEKRAHGFSKWNPYKLFKYGMEGIISFSTKPLKLATFLGLFLSILSGIYLLIVLIQKIFIGRGIPGYPTIANLIILLGGIQLFCLGIIGEYIAKIYMETKDRPIYIIKEEISNDK